MAICTICLKGKMAGRYVRHVHAGLWERKAPNKVREFLPNIQKSTVVFEGKTHQLNLCTRCIKRIKNFPGWKGFSRPVV
ncbi:hypothetical protein A3B56_02140 [Candidatus Roizmanbacteria bacterium RIFCSPLOWO2_01_FULL_45_11]|uniref:50S ribosomal protein L28 n=1 Tax=Candidatus Roizmanbacteria bacterium RIFCSPLOWO2_01_FULL_45_11 TaxID=1802070 RepID=A0A1F7JJ16_9BACT|nr:MAG: hypothetical protein A3B56_02140 [Candidatus Roizmanbacteria bacterium RIFCSPLOWO2_01_FULL_45_11]